MAACDLCGQKLSFMGGETFRAGDTVQGISLGETYTLCDNCMSLVNAAKKQFRLIDDLQDYLEASEGKRRSGEQRTLAYYQTYFRFDAILQDFWQTASQEEKLLYFPVYLWWRITMIIRLNG